MVLDYDFVIKFKKELMNKQSVYLHFHDGCGGQYFTLEKSNDEIRKCINDFLAEYNLKASFTDDGLQFTVEVMMRKLFEIDLQDYEINDNVFSRPSVRGIIFNDDNKIALVYSKNEKYYKFPGGGIHKDEDKKEALIREVREETGLIVIPESICEFGSVMRRQKSNISPHTIFEQENFYYICKVKNQIVEQNLDDYEAEAGFILRFVSLDEAISVNSSYKSEDYFNEIMIQRETKVLKMIKDTIQ